MLWEMKFELLNLSLDWVLGLRLIVVGVFAMCDI